MGKVDWKAKCHDIIRLLAMFLIIMILDIGLFNLVFFTSNVFWEKRVRDVFETYKTTHEGITEGEAIVTDPSGLADERYSELVELLDTEFRDLWPIRLRLAYMGMFMILFFFIGRYAQLKLSTYLKFITLFLPFVQNAFWRNPLNPFGIDQSAIYCVFAVCCILVGAYTTRKWGKTN